MTLQQMRYFIGAAESGSISEAAKRSFTAQSSISGAIKEVENTYGITAFVRDSKGGPPYQKRRRASYRI